MYVDHQPKLCSMPNSNGCVALLVTLNLFWGGCDKKPVVPAPHADAMGAKIEPDLPLLELPPFNLGEPVPGAEENASPLPLDQHLPHADFSIRVQAKRPDDAIGSPIPAVFRVKYRASPAKLPITASCFLKPTVLEESVVVYEGTCMRPVKGGPSIIEVAVGPKVYLVRSADVR